MQMKLNISKGKYTIDHVINHVICSYNRQLQDLEAENVKVKSKYAILLKESRAPTRSGNNININLLVN